MHGIRFVLLHRYNYMFNCTLAILIGMHHLSSNSIAVNATDNINFEYIHVPLRALSSVLGTRLRPNGNLCADQVRCFPRL